MAKIMININGIECLGFEGQTILEIAQENNIDIPTLCHDERVKTFGACGVCVVEMEGSPKLARACSTVASNGMVLKTNTEKVLKNRRIALEFLCSDHSGDCRPPCLTACPGQTDCQGYVGLIANGQFEEANKLIKDRIPMPASIGRVCPHPCETECRRKLVEEPVSIAQLKAFAADKNLASGNVYIPEIKPDSGKKIAVIGGGPGGLSAAYFLRRLGHQITVYDMMPKMGGMIRYGIPEYRLPKSVVDMEVAIFDQMGIKLVNGVKVGRDITFDHIKDTHDATVVAIGAWSSSGLRCPGEELEGVLGGIDFLKDVVLNNTLLTGKKVAVVGGGNTAMDACRTAVRLGASEVYIIYRRTKAEMPAEEIEIREAEEEGVIFKYLTNPIEILGEDGKVSKIRLQKMKLGEPDKSGRRAPVAIEGEEEIIDLDCVISAIGQGVNPEGFAPIDLTKYNTIIADEKYFSTNIKGVFAIGDATNKGASIAIEAIGDAKKAANVIHDYLNGVDAPYRPEFIIKRSLTEKDFADRPKKSREKMAHLSPEERKTNFTEITLGYTDEQAMAEGKRCLECGCGDYFECKLINLANKYDVMPEKYEGEKHDFPIDKSNPFFERNPNKCILCGLCVRVCDEVMGCSALGFADRGFDTSIKPSLGKPVTESECISCGQCVHVCPTGALLETLNIKKPVPLSEKVTNTTCTFCGTGCRTQVTTKNEMILRVLPDTDYDTQSILCAKGRFGFTLADQRTKITSPMIRKNGKLMPVSMYEALMYVAKKVQGLSSRYGESSTAVSISDRLTLEDAFVTKKYANTILKTDNVYCLNGVESGLTKVLGKDSASNTIFDLLSSDVMLLFGEDLMNTQTIPTVEIKKAAARGLKVILISSKESQLDEFTYMKLKPTKGLDLLKEMAKALINLEHKPKNADNFHEFKSSLDGVSVSDDVSKAMELYSKAKKGSIVFEQKAYSTDAQSLMAMIAVISGHIGKPRAGILPLTAGVNTQGVSDLGVSLNGEKLISKIDKGDIKSLLIFGEDVPHINFKNVEFLMVADSFLTETAEMAEVVLPLPSVFSTEGTFTSFTRLLKPLKKSFDSLSPLWENIVSLANISNQDFSFDSLQAIQKAISVEVCGYSDLHKIDVATGKTFAPIGENPVFYQNGFNTESKNANLFMPQSNTIFNQNENTNANYSVFMRYMEAKGLIK